MSDKNESTVTMEKIVNLSKRRGFVFQSSEIYGGLASCWDYGPLGSELKRNVKEAWWRDMVTSRPDLTGRGKDVIEFFRELNKEDGLTLLIVTHEERLSTFADRVIHIKDGIIESDERNAA